MEAVAWSLFVPACLAINIAPGPNNLLSISNAARFGLGAAILASGGRLAAFAAMIVLVALGLGAVLATSTTAFLVIRWLGAAYLIYLGVRLLRSTADAAAIGGGGAAGLAGMMRQECLLALGNPKGIGAFTALFPQFLDPSDAAAAQLFAMGGVFLALECAAILVYAAAGLLARGALRSGRGFAVMNKGLGAFLVLSGVTLAIGSR